MTGFFLIRHASADHVGRCLAGRSPGVHLDRAGRSQARALADHLRGAPLAAVYSSPLDRALETAAPIARSRSIETAVIDAFTEVDFGEWTGEGFDDLRDREDWRCWNESRSTARAPGGESMAEVVERGLGGLVDVGCRHRGEWVAIVSHCDVIRPLVAHFAGIHLDHLLRIEVATASVSAIEVNPWGPRILGINATAPPFWPLEST